MCGTVLYFKTVNVQQICATVHCLLILLHTVTSSRQPLVREPKVGNINIFMYVSVNFNNGIFY
jgi:hypothetical protein